MLKSTERHPRAHYYCPPLFQPLQIIALLNYNLSPQVGLLVCSESYAVGFSALKLARDLSKRVT